MTVEVSETKNNVKGTLKKCKDFMRLCFSSESTKERSKANQSQDFANKLQELQSQADEQEFMRNKASDTLKDIQAMHKQEKGKILDLVDKQSLRSEDLLKLYRNIQNGVKQLIECRVNPTDIETVQGDIVLKKPSDQPAITTRKDQEQVKKTLEAFRAQHKGKSITHQIEQANKDQKVLAALVEQTLDSLQKALKLSSHDIANYRTQVHDIYSHHGERVSDAHTLYQYNELQFQKQELKTMSFGKGKICKQMHAILSLKARQHRRYKILLTESLEAEETRRDHLVEKYKDKQLEKKNKRAREKKMLDDLIQAKKHYEREKIAHEVPFEHVLHVVEEIHRDLIKREMLSPEQRQACQDVLRMSLDNFKFRMQQNTISAFDMIYQNKCREIRQRHLIEKHGTHPLWSRANDVASDGGGILTLGGSVVTAVTLCGVAV